MVIVSSAGCLLLILKLILSDADAIWSLVNFPLANASRLYFGLLQTILIIQGRLSKN